MKAAIDEAARCREEGVSEAILFNLCGHGHFDMQAYIDYAAGKLKITPTRRRKSPWRWLAAGCRLTATRTDG